VNSRHSVVLAALVFLGVGMTLTCLSVESRESRWAPSRENRGDFRGRIVYVDDGDTVVALTASNEQVKVRLASIDAPESSHTNKEAGRVGQPFAEGSKRFLESLVKGKVVDLKCPDTDRYGRAVCDLLVDGESVDREMVRQGWAWANEAANGRYLRDSQMPGLESAARREHRGLWAGANPVAPWEWRKKCWEQGVCPN
jgi:micrococcal nuclease